MKIVKIYGERNTGTIYLEWLMTNNFRVNISNTPEFGWKHRIAPMKDELSEYAKNELIYLCLNKNPYSWLLSMHKRPYHHEELRKLSFSSFLKYPYGDYRNPMVMWNIKNQSYVNMAHYVKNFQIIRYEDLITNYIQTLKTVALAVGIEIPEMYKNMNSVLSHSKGIINQRFHKEFYLQEKWKKNLKPHHVEIINEFLDKDLMNTFNYPVL